MRFGALAVRPSTISGRAGPAVTPARRKDPAASVVAVLPSSETVAPTIGSLSVESTRPDSVVCPAARTMSVAEALRTSVLPSTDAEPLTVKEYEPGARSTLLRFRLRVEFAPAVICAGSNVAFTPAGNPVADRLAS